MDEREPQDSLSVYDHIAQMLDVTAAVAWSKLGLQPDIMSGKFESNLTEAKVAIDLIATMVKSIEGRLDDTDRRQVQGLVRDLQINYVQKSKEATQ